ncbi:putative peptidase family M3 [Colletotrichum karsti]|uniref:Peptidase family M3 n=1 Tax=Colletotrichum karsti TaxID=1095194 RepID=A0A9P6I8D8_9PEZI|nr:putative peptidase family M3 [Colletotrichum karsti]KAF9877612.1 putative peptidase family M3 [Colletotrichum karsti]
MGFKEPRQLPQAPPLFTATPTSILQTAESLIEHLFSVQSQVIEQVQPDDATFANVIMPLVHAENALARESHVLIFYKSVSPDPELRDASGKAQILLDEFAVESALNETIFGLIDAVMRKNEILDSESLQLLKRKHRDHVRNGCSLPEGPRRECFVAIKSQLSRLSVEFRENLANNTGEIWLTPEELDGMPQARILQLEKGQGENEGKLRLPLGGSSFNSSLMVLKRADIRKRTYIAGYNRCNQNVPVFRDIVILRDEAARLLGYSSHAAFRLEDKMAKTVGNVNAFLDDLRERLTPGCHQEIQALREVKKQDVESRGEFFDDRFYLWDHAYYNRLMLEHQYSIDQQKIAEYFPLQHTVFRMLSIFETLFGLVFHDNGNDSLGKDQEYVWHEDVQLLSVWDDAEQGGGFVGYLYLDLFFREGKNGGAANFNVIPGFIKEDGTRQYPATAVVCNVSKPTDESPSLLRHDEVVTLFHELGHAIHDLVSKTKYACFHGTETVLDFGEAPSQMLENWCWTPSQLKTLGKHYSSLSPEYLKLWQSKSTESQKPPCEELPDDMIESLVRSKYVNSALFHLNQLCICKFDMAVHSPESHTVIENMNVSATYNRIRCEIYPAEGPEAVGENDEWGHGYVNFGHLVGDYDAGYYSYLFSKVYSADMFHTVFKADPMNSEEGRRYRYAVLEKGGSQDEMKTLQEFLGREPKSDAFQIELGIA